MLGVADHYLLEPSLTLEDKLLQALQAINNSNSCATHKPAHDQLATISTLRHILNDCKLSVTPPRVGAPPGVMHPQPPGVMYPQPPGMRPPHTDVVPSQPFTPASTMRQDENEWIMVPPRCQSTRCISHAPKAPVATCTRSRTQNAFNPLADDAPNIHFPRHWRRT